MTIPAEMQTGSVVRANLVVAEPINDFVNEALVGENIEPDIFWQGVSDIFRDLAPRNRELLDERDRLQNELDSYYREHPGQPAPAAYRAFLESIGYLQPEPAAFTITTENVDDEIARLAGPQLVVPLLNARFAINAANARWGSLYDALYGTDVIAEDGDLARGGAYNAIRGAAVIAYGRDVLDRIAPLSEGSHATASAYSVEDGALVIRSATGSTGLADAAGFVGYLGDSAHPTSILLRHHGLHAEIVIDAAGSIGSTDGAGINDILLESATTTIMDLEDSVAAVDAEDKALGYRNWRDLMRGTLSEQVTKGNKTFTRVLNPHREYTAPDGSVLTLRGRSLLLIRNVGHLMMTDAVQDAEGNPVPEGILDAIMTALGALADLRGDYQGSNSRTGSMYIVKPKMHGPDEVAFAVELFGRVEQLLGLAANTLKVGIMDEERRTTVNLRACIAVSADRVVFINTGFLDRTGDEIHTSLLAGPIVPKARIKAQPFISAYEDANVDAGLGAGFAGRAQVGKGMWAMPDLMHDMMEQKIGHVRSGASTAWVPSPTAATLHALHYHDTDVGEVQVQVAQREVRGIADILIPPLLEGELTREEILEELDNNVQSILGYVVRWINQGIGCSKVPDIHGVALMEDRATLRIASQLLANWLHHGLVSVADVDESLQRLAPVVDGQNAGDATYEPLVGSESGIAFESARRLIVEGATQPNGYTEPILHEMRRLKKSA